MQHMRTDKEIAEEIAKLKQIKPKVPKATYFGDDNHEAIDAQIKVLSERMDEDEVMDKTQFEDDLEENGRDESRWSPHTGDSARNALNWLTEDDDESPSSSWESIAK